MEFEKNVENTASILHVRGPNYETVTHQLSTIVEAIVTAHVGNDKVDAYILAGYEL